MQIHLTGVFQKVDEGYIGFVEELPGANTQAPTLEEARANLQEAIALVLDANRLLSQEAIAGCDVIREPSQFVLTTSHGQAGPLTGIDGMKAHLGWLVDQEYDLLDPKTQLNDWQPDGALRYAHACCSVGRDS
jgi:predicted RNase H-like HicB family nuclease